jgi:hypothetical protein
MDFYGHGRSPYLANYRHMNIHTSTRQLRLLLQHVSHALCAELLSNASVWLAFRPVCHPPRSALTSHQNRRASLHYLQLVGAVGRGVGSLCASVRFAAG